MFSERSEKRKNVLKIAGFFELTPPEQPGGSVEKWSTLSRVFRALSYDLGVLGADVASHIREKGADPPQGWMSVGSRAHSRILPMQDAKIGFLVFPPSPTQDGFARIQTLARQMGSDLSLLVGISPWGAEKEREFLRERPEAVDILLGSGPGPSFKAKFPDSGRTIWVRPYPRGKTIHSISLYSLSPGDAHNSWKPGENCDIRLIMLKDSIPNNPSIREMIR